VFKGIS